MPTKLHIKGSFIVIKLDATGILNGMIFFRWYLKKDIEGLPKVY